LITTATLVELSAGPLVAARNDQERAARQAHLQQAEADFDPLPFDRSAARAFGQVAASLRKSGRKPAARAYDALIAATTPERAPSAAGTQSELCLSATDRSSVGPIWI
jgi:tRNA(fMet)-specific endonuclease VapC